MKRPVLALACLSLTGCFSKTSDDAKWSIKFVQGIEIETTSKRTTDGKPSKAGFDLEDWTKDGLIGWLIGAVTPKTETGNVDETDGGTGG